MQLHKITNKITYDDVHFIQQDLQFYSSDLEKYEKKSKTQAKFFV